VPAALRPDALELIVAAGSVALVLRTLREDGELRYEILADISGVDTGVTMQVVYHLWSPLASGWLRVIADGLSREDPRVPSITFLWPGAEWGEREAYDMFGIVFEGNRDLRRIYMPPDYLAFPLRKDFVLADDASRGPGEGIRHMERPAPPAEERPAPAMRMSPGAGAVIGPDGARLRISRSGVPAPRSAAGGGMAIGGGTAADGGGLGP
jgi:NADH:ubiquinone oxidoreductase subunit C